MLEELERLRAHRADAPEPDAATVAAARAELMQTVSAEPRRKPRPVPGRARLRKAQRRRRFVLAGGLAAAGIAVAGVLGLHTAGTPQSALAKEMNQLAQVAAGQEWTGIPAPGQYLYTASDGLTEADTMAAGKECSVAQVDHRQSWIGTDGSGAISETRDQGKFTSAADAAACAAMNISDPSSQNSTDNTRFAAGGLSFPTNDWKTLSTDPATLLKQVHERDGGHNIPAEWFVNVADFMRESDVPPVIRAALYQAAALIPGVRLLGTRTTETGQTGLAVAFYADGKPTHELIFDQASGRLLGENYFDASGSLTDWTDYLSQKITDNVPNYPLNPTGNG